MSSLSLVRVYARENVLMEDTELRELSTLEYSPLLWRSLRDRRLPCSRRDTEGWWAASHSARYGG